jgi:DNA-binding transcriptional ArsR family regulator
LYCFNENIRNSLAEVTDLVNEYSSIYNKEMDKHSEKKDRLNKEIENRINKEKESFLNELLRGKIDFSQYDEIHISAALLHYHSLYFYSRNSKGFMYIGSKYERFMTRLEGENEIEKNLNIFKNLSDRTRYEILKLLLKRDHFGQEIAQELSITTATVSYHMNYLAAVRLVEITRKDHKAYYRLNKEAIKVCINFLNKEFEMNK